jgi:hypothetical protein
MKKILLALLFLPFVASAHPGNRDINGCHVDSRTNIEHCGHAKGDGAQSTYYSTKDYSSRAQPTDNKREHTLDITSSKKNVYKPNAPTENKEIMKQSRLKNKRSLQYSNTKRRNTSPYAVKRNQSVKKSENTKKPMQVRTMRTQNRSNDTVLKTSNDRLLLSVLNKYKKGSITDEKALELIKKIFSR